MGSDLWRFVATTSPVLSLALGGMLLVFLSAIGSNRRSIALSVYLLSVLAMVFFSTALLRDGQILSGVPLAGWYSEFQKHFFADSFSYGWLIVLGLFMSVTGVFAKGDLASHDSFTDELALFLFSGCGISLLITASSLLMVFLGLEFLSLPVYVLVGCRRNSPAGSEAAMKYFLFGAFASVFLLLGISILYAGSGSIYFYEVEKYLAVASLPSLAVGVGLMVAVVGFKLGVPPFHQWVPDAYEGAPTSVTGFMGSSVKLAGLALALRLFWGPLLPSVERWSPVLVTLALLAMAVGSLGGLLQRNLKRLLAYSSIAHAGYLLLGVAVAPAHLDTVVLWFYMITYGVMFLGLFGAIAEVERTTGKGSLDALSGLGFGRPLFSVCVTVLVLSAAGIPPLAGFLAKYLVFLQVMRSGHAAPAIVALISGAISVAYYLRILVYLYMREPSQKGAGKLVGEVGGNWLQLSAIILCAGMLVFLGVMPGVVLN